MGNKHIREDMLPLAVFMLQNSFSYSRHWFLNTLRPRHFLGLGYGNPVFNLLNSLFEEKHSEGKTSLSKSLRAKIPRFLGIILPTPINI